MHPLQPHDRGVPAGTSKTRRFIAAGSALALGATLMGATAPSAVAADIPGGSWSTTYEAGEPQPLSNQVYEPVVNLHSESDGVHDLVTSVYSADERGGTGSSGAENVSLIKDRERTTKWLVPRAVNPANPVHAIYTLSQAATVTGYEITSANDSANRDPRNWTISGSNSASAATDPTDASWEQIDTVTDSVIPARRATKRFSVDTPGAYQFYRLTITDVSGSTDIMQVSDWTLLSTEAPSTRVRRVLPSEIVNATANPDNGWQSGSENLDKLHDGDYTTKSLVASPITYTSFYMMYELAEATPIEGYIFTAGNDAPAREPSGWTMWATDDAAVASNPVDTTGWTQIDAHSNMTSHQYRRGSVYYQVATPGNYKWVQFRPTGDLGDRFQMSEWTLTSPLADNPNLAVKIVDARAEGGTGSNNALGYAGGVLADGDASSAILVHDGLDVAIGSDTALTYRIKPTSDSGKNIVVDVEYSDTDGTNTQVASQTAGLTDRDGNDFTIDGQAAALTTGDWSQVVVPLGTLAGKVVNKVVVRYAEQGATAGSIASGLIDDISLADSPFAGDLTVTEANATQLRVGLANTKTLAVITGDGTVAQGNDLAAVLALNDAAGTELPLILMQTDDGVAVSLDPAHRPQQAGVFNASIVATLDGAEASAPLLLTVIADASLTGQFQDLANLACFTVPGIAVDCDGNTYGYDREKLEPLGYIAGQTDQVDIDGTTFSFEVPNIPAGQFDTITPAGQAWNISVPAAATQISFLGTGNEGTQTRDIEIVYTDGTTETVTVTFADWATSDTADFDNAGNTVVHRPQGRLKGTDESDNLYQAVLATTPHDLMAGKTVDYIQLPPKVGNIKPDGQVHLFTFATDAPVDVPVAAPVVTATPVVAQEATVSFGAQLASITDATGSESATINWGDDSATTDGVITSGNVAGSHTYAAPGTYTVTVTVSGDGVSTAVETEITVAHATSTVVVNGPASTDIGSAAVVTATVAPAAATGTVQWAVDGTDVGDPVALEGANTVTYGLAGLAAGNHSIVATYSGDSVYATSTSTAFAVTINKLTSSLALSGSPTTVTIGDAVTLTAAVTPAVAGRTVTFAGPADWSATATTDASGVATTSVTPASVGTASYTASVAEDATHLSASAPTAADITVQKKVLAPGDWTVTGPTGNVNVGGAGSVDVTLPALAVGTVTFQAGSATPVIVNLVDGHASFATSSLAAGSHAITVTYSGDGNYDEPAAKIVNVTVVKNLAEVTLSGPEGDIAIGTDVTFTASVPSAATGTVQFKNGSDNIGSAVTVADGAASITLSDLTLGDYEITAEYSGDAAYETATSGAKEFTVIKRTATVDLATSSASVDVGTEVTLTATVPSDATGTVQFKNGTDDLGAAVTIADGEATLTLSDLPLGANSITAEYSGDGNYDPATSTAKSVEVEKKASSTVLEASATTVTEGDSVTLTATVPLDATGTVQFFEGDDPVSDAVSVTDGKAELTLLGLLPGAHAYSATYSGDATYLSSNSTALTVTADVLVPPVVAPALSAVTVSRAKHAFNQKAAGKRVTLSVNVTGATTGTVTFASASRLLGTAAIVASGDKATATLTVNAKTAVGTYSGLRAVLTSADTSYVSPASTASFKVVRAKVKKKLKVKTKSFKSGTKPKIKVKVAKLNNGRFAAGTVQIRVGKKVVKTVKLKVKRKGKVTVKLSSTYSKTIKVKAKYVPANKTTTAAKSSKVVKVKAK